MGDSFPASAVNPAFLNNAFNFATSAETYEQTYFKARRILSGKNNISTILLPVDLHSFARYRDNILIPYVWYWSKYASYAEMSRILGKSVFSLFVRDKFPIVGMTLRMLRRKSAEIIKGWRKYEARFNATKNRMEQAHAVVELQFKNYHGIDPALFSAFLKILDLASENDAKIVLVKYPLTKSYIAALQEFPKLKTKEFYKFVREKTSKHKGIFWLDYQTTFMRDSLFADPIHMNVRGAELFTKRLARDLQTAVRSKGF